jgi:hypothetical protein
VELFRQERAGRSERSEKPDKIKEERRKRKTPAVTSLPVAPLHDTDGIPVFFKAPEVKSPNRNLSSFVFLDF